MAVGEHESSDVKFDNAATLIVGRRRYPDQTVYGDKKKRTRRDIFVPDAVRDRYGRLPQSATVEWQGRDYAADLEFRTAAGGRRVPVYSFNVKG